MNTLYGYIFSFLLLIMLFPAANAQESRADSLDRRLAEYENLCGMCMNMKVSAASGNHVSKSEAQKLINRFVVANKELKTVEAYMTVIQRRRFAAVGTWFSTGVQPEVEPCPSLPALPMPPVVCRAEYSAESDLAVSPVAVLSASGSGALPESRLKSSKGTFHLLALISAPPVSYGIMAGYRHRRWGGYLSFCSNFVSVEPAYECTSDGSLAGGSTFWSGGAESKSHLSVCGGGLYGVNDMFTVYAGAGYGWRRIAWKDIDGAWAEVSDISNEGLAVDAGLLVTFRHLALSAGISSISFKTVVFNVGIGVSF